MRENESVKWLYDNLTEEGYNVGKDYAEFDSLIVNNDESRKWVYDTAISLGYNVGKDYNEFSSLVLPAQQPKGGENGYTLTGGELGLKEEAVEEPKKEEPKKEDPKKTAPNRVYSLRNIGSGLPLVKSTDFSAMVNQGATTDAAFKRMEQNKEFNLTDEDRERMAQHLQEKTNSLMSNAQNASPNLDYGSYAESPNVEGEELEVSAEELEKAQQKTNQQMVEGMTTEAAINRYMDAGRENPGLVLAEGVVGGLLGEYSKERASRKQQVEKDVERNADVTRVAANPYSYSVDPYNQAAFKSGATKLRNADDLKMMEEFAADAKNRLLTDEALRNEAQADAELLGMSLDDYINKIAVPVLQQRMYEEWLAPQEEKAKEYYNGVIAAAEGSLIGMLLGSTRTETEKYLSQVGQEAWRQDASLLDRALSGAGSMFLDLPIFGGFGSLASVPTKYVGGQVFKHLAKNEAKKVIARGASEAAAQRYANYAVTNGLKNRILLNLSTSPLQSGLTFGMFDAGKAALNMSLNGEWDWSELGKSAGGGFLLGAALGGTNAVGGGVTAGLTGGVKTAAKIAEFGVENAVFTEGGRLIGKLHGQQPENGWWEDYLESGATLLMLKAPNIVKNVSAIKGDKEASEVFAFNELEREQLGKYGEDLNAVLESLLPQSKRVFEDGLKINEGTFTEEYRRVMSDPEISMTTKAKLMGIVEGKVMPAPRVVDAQIEGNRVMTYDPMGRLVEVKEYATEAKANAEYKKVANAAEIESIAVLEDVYMRIKGYEADELTVKEWLAKNPKVTMERVAEIVAKNSAGEKLTDAEQKILESLRQARREGLNDVRHLNDVLAGLDVDAKDVMSGLDKPIDKRTERENRAVRAYTDVLFREVKDKIQEPYRRGEAQRAADDVWRAANNVKWANEDVKLLADRIYESDRQIDETANDGMIYTTTNNKGEKIIITGGKVVLDNEGYIDVNQSEGLVALMPDGTKKPVRVDELREKVEVANAEEIKAVKREEIANELANVIETESEWWEFLPTDNGEVKTENGKPMTEPMADASQNGKLVPGAEIEIAFDGEVYKLKVEGRDERGDIILSGEGASMAVPELAVLEGMKEAERFRNGEVKGENQIEVAPVATTATTEMQTAPVTQAETVQPPVVAPKVAEVTDFFRMDGKNYAVVSRNEDGSVTVDVDGKRAVLPAETNFTAAVPTDKGGKVLFTEMPAEKTLEYFVQRVPNSQARAQMIENNRKQAESALKKYDKEPNVGTDPDAYEATMNKWEADKKAAQAKVDYWDEVAKRDAEISQSEMRESVEAVKPREVIEMTPDEFVANQLGGIKITPESFQKETGTKAEQKQMVGVIAGKEKGGVSIERAAEIIYESYGDELRGLGFNGDMQDVRDMIIDVLSNGNPRSFARKGLEMRQQTDVEQQLAELRGVANALNFESIEEQIAYEESIMPRIMQELKGFDETEYFNNLAENYENDTTRESENTRGSSELLQGEQPADNAGATNLGEPGQGGEVQGDVYSSGENAAPQGNQQVSGSEIPNNQNRDNVSQVEGVAEGEPVGQSGVAASEGNSLANAVLEKAAEKQKKNLNDRIREAVTKGRIKQWEKRTGISVRVVESIDEVTNRQAHAALEAGQIVKGWIDGNEVVIYLPNIESVEDVDKTYIHEVVAHKGLKILMGKDFDKLCDKVWEMMSEEQRKEYLAYIGANLENPTQADMRDAADEYMAYLAESVELTETEKGIWQKIVDAIREFLLGEGVKLTDKDIENLIRASYANLANKSAKVEAPAIELGAEVEFVYDGNVYNMTVKNKSEDGYVSLSGEAMAMILPEDVLLEGIKQAAALKGGNGGTKFSKKGGKNKSSLNPAAPGKPVNATAKLDELFAKIDKLKQTYNSRTSKKTRGFITDIARELDLTKDESSHYRTFPTELGDITLRVSNHNSKLKEFEDRHEDEGVSIIISAKKNKKIDRRDSTGKSHVDEFFYPKQSLERSQGRPLVQILESIKDFLTTGVYVDKTGIAQPEDSRGIRFRKVTPEMDAEYMAAVENGDMESAERLVKEAAKLAMPDTKVVDEDGYPMPMFHGDRKKGRYKFSTDTFFTPNEQYAKRYTGGTGEVYPVYLNIEKPFDVRDNEAREIFTEFNSGNAPVETTTGALDWGQYTYEDLQEYIEENYPGEYDGFILDEGGEPDYNGNVVHRGLSYIPFTSNQAKYSSFVTYDDNGNVIPLSERFNEEKEDIRFRRVFHGSGAKFDKFDHSFMGTGEGNQAFGWGTYVTEVEGIGKQYAEAQAMPHLRTPQMAVYDDLSRYDGDFYSAKQNLLDYYNSVLEKYPDNYTIATRKNLLEDITETDYKKSHIFKSRNLYSVEIPDDNGSNYLHWEDVVPKKVETAVKERLLERLSEGQGEAYKSDLKQELDDVFRYSDFSGASLYINISAYLGGDKQASLFLSDMGFVGISYPAQAMTGGRADKARNYVIFNENDAQIEDRTMFRRANKNQDIFVSNAQRAVEGIKQEKATPQQWFAMIKKDGGLKAGEDKWMGLSDWLNEKKEAGVKSLTKDEVLEFIRANKIQIEEVEYNDDFSQRKSAYSEAIADVIGQPVGNAMYGRYYGENGYTLAISGPMKDVDATKQMLSEKYGIDIKSIGDELWEEVSKVKLPNRINPTRLDHTTEGLDNKKEIALVVPTIESWNQSDEVHFGDAGNGRAVAWVRFGETTDSEGNRVLVIDEIQSKRHQDAREKGYKDTSNLTAERQENGIWHIFNNGEFVAPVAKWNANTEQEAVEYYAKDLIPEAPFEKNWQELAMKRMLRLAAEEDFDKVAWTTGEQQAERYNIRHVVNELEVFSPDSEGEREVNLVTDRADIYLDVNSEGMIIGQQDTFANNLVGKSLSDILGKEVAASILAGEYDDTKTNGHDITFGGEGMKGFYDRMLPSFVSKYTKKWGAKVGTVEMPSLEQNNVMHSVDVTPEMKESVMEGQTMFRRGDRNDRNFENKNITLHTTGDGRIVRYEQLELFDTDERTTTDIQRGASGGNQTADNRTRTGDIQRDGLAGGDALTLINAPLRPLEEGETSLVQRVFTKSKAFDFTAGEQIESLEDVAYIFKNLEDESIENSFAVLVKDGKPVVLHLGMGHYTSSIINASAVAVAMENVKPDKVYLVHNHPSGALKASAEDVDTLKGFRTVYGDIVEKGIIINLKSGKFGIYDTAQETSEERSTKVEGGAEIPVETFAFNKQVFDKDFNPAELFQVKDDSDVAAFISSNRLGDRNKIGLLVCNNQNRVVGNVFTPFVGITAASAKKVAKEIVYYTTVMGGNRPVLFGRFPALSAAAKSNLGAYIGLYSGGTIKLLDMVDVESRESVLYEDEMAYGDKSVDNSLNAQEERTLFSKKELTPEQKAKQEALKENAKAIRRLHNVTSRYPITALRNLGFALETQEQRDMHDRLFAERDAITGESMPAGLQTNPQAMTLQERITESLLKHAEQEKENVEMRLSAIRAYGRDLANVIKLMNAQKGYDKRTVRIFTDLVKMYLRNNAMSGMSSYKIIRLLNLMQKATGGHAKTVNGAAVKIAEIITNEHTKQLKEIMEKQMKTGAERVNASGVVVQGGVDIIGKRILNTYKDAINLDDEGFEEKYNDSFKRVGEIQKQLEENGSNTALENQLEEAQAEADAMLLAATYRNEVKAAEADITKIKDELTGKRTKAEKGEITWKEYHEFAKTINSQIVQLRAQQIDAYQKVLHALSGDIYEGVQRARAFREAEAMRVQRIHDMAESDMNGVDKSAERKEPGAAGKTVDMVVYKNPIVRTMMNGLGTYENYMKYFGRDHLDGRGELFNHFITAFTEAQNKEWKESQNDFNILEAAAQEIFGKKRIGKTYKSIARESTKPSGVILKYWNGGATVERELTIGQLMYLYMTEKQAEGQMKLRNMGLTEEKVQGAVEQLPTKYKKFADYIQAEFLPQMRPRMNEVHQRMFGASMSEVENYFPLKVNMGARQGNDDLNNTADTIPSTITGSVIKRRVNVTPIDLMANAFDVLNEHIVDMEHWAAYAEFIRDNNTLINDKDFKNRVQNTKSVRYGDGETLWKNFVDTARIATGNYKSKADYLAKLMSGANAAKITFGYYTALKQLASMPAFWSDAKIWDAVWYSVNPMGSWRWAIKNLPGFEERWKGRTAGNERLGENEYSIHDSRIMKAARMVGMTPNAFVDAVVVASGARAVYKDRLNFYKKLGMTEYEADRRAKNDAAISYNETQQSGQGAYLSTLQKDGGLVALLTTLFRNSQMAFQRRVVGSMVEIGKKLARGERIREATKQKYIKMGMSEEAAGKQATKDFYKSYAKDITNLAIFGYGMNYVWALMGELPYLLFGDDDEEKEKIFDTAAKMGITGTFEGFTCGNFAKSLYEKHITDGKYAVGLLEAPFEGDLQVVFERFEKDGTIAGVLQLAMFATEMNTGISPQRLIDTVTAFIYYSNGDIDKATRAQLFALRLLKAPQSQQDKLILDETDGADVEEVKSIAEWYIKYKMARNFPLGSEDEKRVDKYANKFVETLKERVEKEYSPEDISVIFDQSSDTEKEILKKKWIEGMDERNGTNVAKSLRKEKLEELLGSPVENAATKALHKYSKVNTYEKLETFEDLERWYEYKVLHDKFKSDYEKIRDGEELSPEERAKAVEHYGVYADKGFKEVINAIGAHKKFIKQNKDPEWRMSEVRRLTDIATEIMKRYE